jgi:predicted anti-sigma-YlaC factor YlaD
MSGPQDPAAAGRDRLRAAQADREQVIEALKGAFVQDRLTRDELGAPAGQALSARTYAELAAATAGIPAGPAAARPARPQAPARRRPLAGAAAWSATCLVIAVAAVLAGGQLDDPVHPSPIEGLLPVFNTVALAAVLAAGLILVAGVTNSMEQRHSRRQLPPRPGSGGHVLDVGRRGGRVA